MSVAPCDVLDFWLGEVSPEQHFAKDDALDRTITDRFGATHDALLVEKFEGMGDEKALAFARDHRAVQARYGRFPTRNAALRHTSSPAEQTYLSRPNADW